MAEARAPVASQSAAGVADAPNAGLAFATALFEEWERAGVEHVCVCPGSRSAPLAIAAAASGLRRWTHLDERSAGFFALGLWPTLWTLVVVQVLYRAGRYGLAKPAREVLFTVLPREEKYKSKAFIDAAVYRGGDLVSGWIYAGLAFLGLTVGPIALVALPAGILWAVISLRVGRTGEKLALELEGVGGSSSMTIA